jgi:tetratricopeptide (TPR) repeat protein
MGSALTRPVGVTAAGAQTMPGQAPTGQPGVTVPLARHYTRRPDTVGGLSELLVPGSAVALVPDQGAGTSPWDWAASRGKTQCAAHAAIQLQQSGGVDLVAWVDASGRASLLDGLAEAALRAGLDREGGAERAASRFRAWLRGTRQRWLVVLDDLRDAADAEGLWPAGPAGITLVTARDPAAVAGSPARLVPVPCYSQREAVAALSNWLSTDPEQRSGHLDLVLDLGCEPAAVAHAGAVISTAELTCRDYHEQFTRRRERIEDALGCQVPAPAVTWVLSADHAEILEPGAGTWPMLALASVLAPHGMPAALLTSGPARRYLAAAPQQAQAAMKALQEAGLLAPGWNGPLPVATMSVPLQAAVRASAGKKLLGQAVATAADALAESWPGDDPQSPAAALHRSSAAALRSAAGDALLAGGQHHRALVAAGRSWEAAGLAGPAAAWWQELAGDSARLLGDDHEDTLAAGCLAASALLAAGQPEDALTWAGWVTGRREATLGPDHPATFKAAALHGRALGAAGRSGEAVAMLHDAAARSARVLGPVHATTLAAQHDLADAFLAAGRPADAVTTLRQAVTALAKSLGRDDASTWSAAERLAAACMAAGRADEAIDALGDVLSRRERLAGAGHPDALRTRALLASVHATAGHVSAALRQYQLAHADYLRVLGAGHRETLACSAGLARAYAASGQMTAAMSLLADAISVAGRVLPPGDPLTCDLEQARNGLWR